MSYADFFVCYNFWRWRFAVFHLAFLRSMRDKQPTEYKAKSLAQCGTVYEFFVEEYGSFIFIYPS